MDKVKISYFIIKKNTKKIKIFGIIKKVKYRKEIEEYLIFIQYVLMYSKILFDYKL